MRSQASWQVLPELSFDSPCQMRSQYVVIKMYRGIWLQGVSSIRTCDMWHILAGCWSSLWGFWKTCDQALQSPTIKSLLQMRRGTCGASTTFSTTGSLSGCCTSAAGGTARRPRTRATPLREADSWYTGAMERTGTTLPPNMAWQTPWTCRTGSPDPDGPSAGPPTLSGAQRAAAFAMRCAWGYVFENVYYNGLTAVHLRLDIDRCTQVPKIVIALFPGKESQLWTCYRRLMPGLGSYDRMSAVNEKKEWQ